MLSQVCQRINAFSRLIFGVGGPTHTVSVLPNVSKRNTNYFLKKTISHFAVERKKLKIIVSKIERAKLVWKPFRNTKLPMKTGWVRDSRLNRPFLIGNFSSITVAEYEITADGFIFLPVCPVDSVSVRVD